MKIFWPQQGQFEQVLKQLQQAPVHQPFAPELLAFTQALSKQLIQMRHLPEVVALGFWLRKANIQQLQQDFQQRQVKKLIRARGITFHIAPSNVDTIFVYSWLLALLAGNKNIIRLSSKSDMNEVLKAIVALLPAHETVANTTFICTYDHAEQATAILSNVCHTRVIWGGDETVQAIRQVPLAPLANELVFPDRFSLALLHSETINQLDDLALDQLLEQFYNDVFWFDQMACSSPRLIVWQGASSERFWQGFEKKIQQKQYTLMAATQVLKYTTSLQLAVNSSVEQVVSTPYYSRVAFNDVQANVREQHCGGGLFYEYEIDLLDELAHVIVDKDQTLAYYGFSKQTLYQLAQTILTRGIDRIVPVGQALNFDGVWDGQSFLTSFTREVVIK